MISIIILLTLFLSSTPVRGQVFTDYQENPVLTKVETSTAIAQPAVIKNGNIFSIWFTDAIGGVYRISNMKSANGIDWYDKKTLQLSNNPVLTDPFMFEENNQFSLYYASHTNGAYAIWKSAPSTDGVTYSLGAEQKILTPSQQWEGTNLSCPSVIKDQSTYYLFYAASGTGNWAVGMATSSDGTNWQKCPNNPITLSSAGPHIMKFNNRFYLYSHSGPGVQIQEADSLNGCNTIWSAPRDAGAHFNDPSPIQVGNDIWVYGSSNTAAGQTIHLAGTAPIQKPSYPIVIVPGMFASWNKQAILHNGVVSPDTWKMNMNVSEYDALSQTLQNNGRTLNSDYFLFPYDWRESVVNTADNLNLFLNNRVWSAHPYQPVQIVGHSLGGVVARVFADKYTTKPIKQIITAGAPHLGVVQSYKPLDSGELERENSLMWLAEKMTLMLNKTLLQSDKDTFAQRFPVLFDLLPTFPYLQNEVGSLIQSTLINPLISQFPFLSSPRIASYYMGGSGTQTLAGYVLDSQRKPISSYFEDGDNLVISSSSKNQTVPIPVQNHGELIYSQESIKAILSKLNVAVQANTIPQGKPTQLYPAILSFIQSPATMEIIRNGVTTNETDGMIHLQNTVDGIYTLRVTGQATGEYTVSIWLIGATDDKWIQFKKQTVLGQVDDYTISFNGASGGTAVEYVAPTPTSLPTPTRITTIAPTIKPTCRPEPTKKLHPTQKPHPTKKPHSTKTEKEEEREVFKFDNKMWRYINWFLQELKKRI